KTRVPNLCIPSRLTSAAVCRLATGCGAGGAVPPPGKAPEAARAMVATATKPKAEKGKGRTGRAEKGGVGRGAAGNAGGGGDGGGSAAVRTTGGGAGGGEGMVRRWRHFEQEAVRPAARSGAENTALQLGQEKRIVMGRTPAGCWATAII